MLSEKEILTMQNRQFAAESALRYFKEVKSVNSPNIPDKVCELYPQHERGSNWDHLIVDQYREKYPLSIMRAIFCSLKTGTGRCFEKASICYSSIACNPRIITNSSVIICDLIDYDHTFILITGKFIKNLFYKTLKDLSVCTMVLDAWTEDWYFPNLDSITEYRYNLRHIADPWQEEIRNLCKHSEFKQNDIPLEADVDSDPKCRPYY